MKQLIVFMAIAALAGCGVETATTAVTAAAIKKKELEEGRKTQERMQQKIDQAMDQMQQRGQHAGDAAER